MAGNSFAIACFLLVGHLAAVVLNYHAVIFLTLPQKLQALNDNLILKGVSKFPVPLLCNCMIQTAPATDHLTGTTEVINRETTTKGKPGQKVISAIVAGSATVFCLLVVFFIWLILNQRKKKR